MAATIVKLTILAGAGVVVTVLSKDAGGFPDVTKLFSSAFKVVTKHLQQDKDESKSMGKQQNDALLAQVNNLRNQLQLLASSRTVTIVTVSKTGVRTYSMVTVTVIGVIGYCYIRWKGWKLSDLMFVTRRNFDNAYSSVEKQLDSVSTSVSSTKQFLSSRIDRVDITVADTLEITASTKDEVDKLHEELSEIDGCFKSVNLAVQDLELKLNRIEGSQDSTAHGIYQLMKIVEHLEKRRIKPPLSGSRQALEAPQDTSSSSNSSILSLQTPEFPSPSSNTKILFSSRTVSAAGLKKIQETATSLTSPSTPRPHLEASRTPDTKNSAPSPDPSVSSIMGLFGWKLPSRSIARSQSSLR